MAGRRAQRGDQLVLGAPLSERTDLLGRLRAALGPGWALVEQAAAVAEAQGSSLYLVGGPVRDALLGRPVSDVDLAVAGDAPRLTDRIIAHHGGQIHVHVPFRTAKWTTPTGQVVDLASARSEWYPHSGALPTVKPGSLYEDLHRRDFTINAMAVGLVGDEQGRLFDPFGGWPDLQAGRLVVLHDASFVDDPTRILRLVRFASRFGFEVVPHTLGLAQAAIAADAFNALSAERRGAELHRLFAEPALAEAVRLLQAWGALDRLFPGVDAVALAGRVGGLSGPDAAERVWLAVAASLPPAERARHERLVPGGKAAFLRFMLGPERVADAIGALAGAARASEAGEALTGLDPVELVAVAAAGGAAADWVRWWLAAGQGRRPALDGHALMRAGVPPGPGLGLALRAALRVAWDDGGEAEQREAALAAGAAAPRR